MTNPLLLKVKLPGRIFQLPSKGIFYEPGILAESVKDAEVEVQPLSALAEMKLRSPDMLFSGRALREICRECIPEILIPDRLISKDVDAIFCFLRIVTYGPSMSVKSTHDCRERNVHDYMVDVENIVMSANNKILDHLDMLYDMQLSNGQKIKLRPVRFQDAIDMIHLKQEIQNDINKNGSMEPILLENAVVRDLLAVIEAVEDVIDQTMIREWIKLLPRKIFTEIVDQSKKSNDWGFNLNVKLKCKDCEAEYYHNLELDPINFFSG